MRLAISTGGAFHLAINLRLPIVPLFIIIPPAINPGRGLNASSGTIDIFVQPIVDTREWKLDDLITHKESVRQQFVKWNRAYAAEDMA